MNVQQTVFLMMRSYPAQFSTRVEALLHLFDSPDAVWKDGELVLRSPDRLHGHPYVFDDSHLAAQFEQAKGTPQESAAAAQWMAQRYTNVQRQFVADHASTLSLIRSSEFAEGSALTFAGLHFDDMPDDITPDWIDAAKELARAIRLHRYLNTSGESEDHALRSRLALFDAQERCSRFLERVDAPAAGSGEHAVRLRNLQRDAAALGYRVIEQTDAP